MQPLRPLNNNVLLALDTQSGREVIIVGKGLGFQPPDQLAKDDPNIEKIFRLDHGSNRRGFLQLVETVAAEVIGVAEEILHLAEQQFGGLGEESHLTLAEHLAAAIERAERAMALPNPFLPQIQLLYPEEYQLAGRAVALVQERLNCQLPEEEQGVLALHLLGAHKQQAPKLVARHTALIREAAAYLAEQANIQWADDDPRLARVLLHLRLAIDQISQGKAEVNPLLDQIKQNYPEAFRTARNLGDLIGERLERLVSDHEVGYLTLHLQRLKGVTN